MPSLLPPPSVLEGWDPILPRTLSPSSIKTFLKCPEQFRRSYLIAEPLRPSGFFVIGDAEHKAREKDLGQKVDTYRNLPIEDVKTIAAEAFDDRVTADGGPGEIDWEDTPPGPSKDLAVGLAAVYAEDVSVGIQPVSVEKEVQLEIPGLAPLIRGYVDVEQTDRIRDVKTANSSRAKNKLPGEWILQSAMYSAATGLPTVFDVNVKTKTPYVLSGDVNPELRAHDDGLAGERISRAALSAAGGMMAYLNAFGPDDPWPGAATQLVPPCGFCSFAPSCRWLA